MGCRGFTLCEGTETTDACGENGRRGSLSPGRTLLSSGRGRRSSDSLPRGVCLSVAAEFEDEIFTEEPPIGAWGDWS